MWLRILRGIGVGLFLGGWMSFHFLACFWVIVVFYTHGEFKPLMIAIMYTIYAGWFTNVYLSYKRDVYHGFRKPIEL